MAQDVDVVGAARPHDLGGERVDAEADFEGPAQQQRTEVTSTSAAPAFPWSTRHGLVGLRRLLDPITQDHCDFYDDHGLYDDYRGRVLDARDQPDLLD